MKIYNSNIFLIFSLIITTSCWQQDNKTIDLNSISISTNKQNDSIYFHSKYFNQLRGYIIANGKIDTVDASSILGKHMYIEYHTISYRNINLTVDKTNRIYFTNSGTEQKKIGNILKTDDNFVIIECDEEQGKKEIFEIYNEILKRISTE